MLQSITTALLGNSMRIAYFTDTYFPQINGVSISIDNFARHLRKAGHTVYIFAPKLKGFIDTDPSIIRLASFKVLSSEPETRVPIPIPNKSIQTMFTLEFDIVHAHGNGPFSFLGYEVARIKGIPYILTFHTLHTKYTHYVFNGKLIKPYMVAAGLKTFANLCDGVITPSEKMKNELYSYGVKKSIKVLPNFIEYKTFRTRSHGFLRKRFNIPASSPILLTVGRLGKEKNFEFILKMFQKLAKRDASSHIVIVGQGPEEKNLKSLAKRLQILERVHFAEEVGKDLMPQVYADATLFVFASTTETQGVCVLEAAAAALPLVLVNDRAYEQIVKHGVNGFLLPLKQDAFVETIAKLLNDESLRKKLGAASQKILEKNYQPDMTTQHLLLYYASILHGYKKKKQILRDLLEKARLVRPYTAAQIFTRFLGEIERRI